MFVYYSRFGELIHNGAVIGHGYSGFGEGRNNPKMEMVPEVGPIPVGIYRMTVEPYGAHFRLAEPVIRLTPQGETNTFRRDGFLIHGNNATNDASHGCIIQNRAVRAAIETAIKAGDDLLEVAKEAAPSFVS